MNEISVELGRSTDLQHVRSDALSAHLRLGRPLSAATTMSLSLVVVYSRLVITAVGILIGSALANAAGVPDLISVPFAALALIIILHPVALPYLLATWTVGVRTAYGPSADALWDIVFLSSFAPYLLLLCWFAVRTWRRGPRRDALLPACLVGMYVGVCEYAVLAVETVARVG